MLSRFRALPRGPLVGPLTTLRYAREPSQTIADLRARFGDAWTIRTPNGPLVMVGTPELAKTVFTADATTLDVFAQEPMRNVFGPRSLLASAGEPHRRDRKLLAPPFHGARMRAYGEIMRDATRTRIAALRPGDRFRAHDVTSRIALDVILRAVFGIRGEAEARHAEPRIEHVLATLDPLLFFVRGLNTPLYPPFRRFRAARAEFEALMAPMIAARRADHARGREPSEDILGMMVAARYDDGSEMSDESIRDQMLTLLAAGHETTAIALAWALREIALHPEVRERALAEIDALGEEAAPEALAKLPFLGAIADETMRLHTIVTDVVRLLRAPLALGKWTVPAGVAVSVAIIGIHEDPTLYPEPAAFRPQRFLERRFSPFEFMPFGGGHRRCIGAAFSDFEMRVVLGTLLRELDLELIDRGPEPAVRRNITMGPANGVPLRVLARRTQTARAA